MIGQLRLFRMKEELDFTHSQISSEEGGAIVLEKSAASKKDYHARKKAVAASKKDYHARKIARSRLGTCCSPI